VTNHPNRFPAYRVSLPNGRFAHVRGKAAAISRACQLIESDGGEAVPTAHRKELMLIAGYGVQIVRVSAEIAHSVGL